LYLWQGPNAKIPRDARIQPRKEDFASLMDGPSPIPRDVRRMSRKEDFASLMEKGTRTERTCRIKRSRWCRRKTS